MTYNVENEQGLNFGENQFRSAFEFSAIGMALAAPNGTLLEVNKSFCRILGYSEAELLARTFQDLTYPDDLEKDLHLLHDLVVGKKQGYHLEKRYVHADGHLVWVLLSVSAVKDASGELIHFIKQIQDISYRKEQALQLVHSENQFRSAFEFSAIGMALAKPDGSLFKVNKSLCKMMGYSQEELLQFTFQNITHPDDLETDLNLLKELKDGKRLSYEMEKRYVHADGHIIYALLAVSAVKNSDGNIDQLIKQIQDISQIKAKELILKKLNETIKENNDALIYKNEELENYAFVASHDLQEPLRMVTGFLSKIEKKYHEILDEDGKKYIHFAMDGAQRMRMLILNILEYSTIAKTDESNTTEVDLTLIVKEVVDTLMLNNRPDVEIQLDVLPVVSANPVSMRQLFSNLISNAIKYQPAGNKAIVKINVTDILNEWEFSIADNGIGIDARGLKLVFNIFQRLHSKEQYSGTGIGLAICKRIITNLKGRIWAESMPGEGSTFYFTLPK